MTEVSVRVDVLRGTFKIVPSANDESGYIVENPRYNPLSIKADSLGGSVDQFLQSVHLLKPTSEQLSKQQARSELGKKLWEQRKKEGKLPNVGRPKSK